MFRPFQCHFCVCLDGTFLFSATNQVKHLKISGFRVFALWVGYFGQKTHFSVFGPNWSKSLRNGPKWSKTVRRHFWTIWDHFWMIWTNLDPKRKKWVFRQKRLLTVIVKHPVHEIHLAPVKSYLVMRILRIPWDDLEIFGQLWDNFPVN